MRRTLVLTTAIVAGLMTITPPAQAKFNIRLEVNGPGLAGPIELFNPGMDIGCVFSRPCSLTSLAPARPFGPRYEVIESLEGHHAQGRMMDRIVHDLYPYAPGGPRVFTAQGQTWHDWNRIRRVPGGWTPADPSLMKALVAHGLPSERPVERILAATTAAPEPQEARSSMVGALVGIGVLIAGGGILVRPLWRRRSPGD